MPNNLLDITTLWQCAEQLFGFTLEISQSLDVLRKQAVEADKLLILGMHDRNGLLERILSRRRTLLQLNVSNQLVQLSLNLVFPALLILEDHEVISASMVVPEKALANVLVLE